MHYKTLVLGLIEQNPDLHQNLRSKNSLISTMNQWAVILHNLHQEMVAQLKIAQPKSSEHQASSQALELAIAELQTLMKSEYDSNSPLSLDQAIDYLKQHHPNR